ncbi:hypothetical protein ACFXK0_07045 [Nocardia sp. NPDC059177]|uniref:hypothetical protein n=1 Tax=Nocardia sp. NPDC059177 TaxID=3346759 RepID=UPI00367C5E26
MGSDPRLAVSRAAGWISPLVLAGARIAGTWEQADSEILVSTFDGETLPAGELATAVDRLGGPPGRTARTV